MILNIIITFFCLIGLLVLHEFGHFILAKKFGVKVEEFGVGYPPRLFGKKIGETIYSVNLLPFGAFVRMPGETEHLEDIWSFFKKPLWQRAAIVLGGVVSFWLVSFFIFSAIPTGVAISGTAPLSPAEVAGLQTTDVIESISVGGTTLPVFKISDAQKIISDNKGGVIVLNIQRGSEKMNIPVVPRISPPEGEGALGIGLAYGVAKRNYPLYLAPWKGLLRTCEFTAEIPVGWAKAISYAAKRQPTGVEMVGPIGIFQMFLNALKEGGQYFILFLGLVSLYMAVFNILPIPSLDGGKLLFLAIEKIKGKPVKQETEQKITVFFFSALILMMIIVSVKDIGKFFK